MSLAEAPRSTLGGGVELFWTLVRTDFKARYHGTLSGFVWALLKPTSLFVVLMSVFSLVFASDPNYKLDLIIGLFLWDFFAEGTKTGVTSLHTKGYLLTKARCPSGGTWLSRSGSSLPRSSTRSSSFPSTITGTCSSGRRL